MTLFISSVMYADYRHWVTASGGKGVDNEKCTPGAENEGHRAERV